MKKSLLIYVYVYFSVFIFSSCAKDDPITASLELDKSELFFSEEGGDLYVELASAKHWTTSSSQEWIKISPSEGDGGTENIKFEVIKNEAYEDRQGIVTFQSDDVIKQVKVNQKKKNAIILSSSKLVLDSQEAEIEILIKTNVDYSFEIEESALDWIKLEQSKSRSLREESVRFQITQNLSSQKRIGLIRFKDKNSDLEEIVEINQNIGDVFHVYVKDAGSLAQILGENANLARKLILTGNLNGTDVKLINQLDSLKTLDISQSRIVAGGNAYATSGDYGTPLYTKNDEIGESMFNFSQPLEIVLPISIKSIGSRSFSNCTNLKKIVIPLGVITIGENAFQGCYSLESAILPEKLQKMGNDVFSECRSLKSMVLPNSLEKLPERAFINCESLRSINIPAKITIIPESILAGSGVEELILPNGVVEIGDQAFYGCNALRKINLPQGIQKIGKEVFTDCMKLENIIIPSSLKEIPSKTFWACTSLKNIELHDGIEYIGSNAFMYCTSLLSIKFPNNKNLKRVNRSMFVGCKSLKSVVLNENIVEIGDYVFNDCELLERVEIRGNISYLEPKTFGGCSMLKELVLYSLTPPNLEVSEYSGYTVFDETHYSKCTILVPANVVESYKSDLDWSKFSNIKSL